MNSFIHSFSKYISTYYSTGTIIWEKGVGLLKQKKKTIPS